MIDDLLPSAAEVREQLIKILGSDAFKSAQRSSALLKYLVEQTLSGKEDAIKEFSLGVDVLGRGPSFDPRTDPIARVEASRLRGRLEAYYATDGKADVLLVTLPKGGYVPHFERRLITSDSVAAPSHGLHYNRATMAACMVAALAILVAAAAWTIRGNEWKSSAASSPLVQQFEVELTTDGVVGSLVSNDIVISPDGQRIAFIVRGVDGVAHLYSRHLEQTQATRLAGTEGARLPFFSPDGKWVGFLSQSHKIKKVNVDGGAPMELCDADDMFGASWGEDGVIITALGPRNTLSRVPAAGGAPEVVIRSEVDSEQLIWPQILPGGQFVIYGVNSGSGSDTSRVEVQSIRGGKRRVLITGGAFARYLVNGYLLYINQGTLFAAPFDVQSLTLTGSAVPVVKDISYSFSFGYAQFDVSNTGTLVYRRGAESRPSVLEWIDRGGNKTPYLAKPDNYGWMKLSPDGKQLAVAVVDSGSKSIRLFDSVSKSMRTVVSQGCDCGGLVWSGSNLIYGTRSAMYSLDTAHENSTPTRLTDIEKLYVPWSLNTKIGRLAFYDRTPEHGFDLWTVPIETSGTGIKLGKPALFIDGVAFTHYPSFSPDGRWLAHSSNETELREVYVRRFPDTGYKVKISVGDASQVRWSPNNREIFYRTSERQIMVVKYRIEGDTFIAEVPRLWSPDVLADAGIIPNYDIAADGERILAALPSASAPVQSPSHASFILNFHEEVRRQLAAK